MMKNRTMVVAFNAVVGFSFFFLFILPLLLFGPGYAASWWLASLPAFFIFSVVLVIINLVLHANGVMYAKIEAQDWKGLVEWLLPRIIRPTGRISRSPMAPVRVRLYVDACILLGDHDRIHELEDRLAGAGSPLLASQALAFGLSRFVRNRVDEAADFFERYLDSAKTESRDWLRFAYGFCRVLQGRFDDSVPYLKEAALSADAVLAMIGGYLLSSLQALVAKNGHSDELADLARSARERILRSFPGKKLDAECERAAGELHVVFFGKILDDAKAWLVDKTLNADLDSADKPSR